MRLFISSLVCELLIFMSEPDLFKLLLLDIRGWVILEVIAATFKLVRGRKLGLLISIGVEGFKRGLVSRSLGLLEGARRVRESDRAAWFS